MNKAYESYFGLWWTTIAYVVLFGAFLLFVPFYRKADRKPAGAFIAFMTAFAVEMFGVPLSLYFVMWAFGKSLPFGVLWGRTLSGVIGMTGHYLFLASILTGGYLIVAGWSRIYQDYWSKEEDEGRLVKEGPYRYIRHPQYTGFLLLALGALFEWATIILLLLWPVLAVLYYRLARREDRELERSFGWEWKEYAEKTGMFFP
ncbi:MAG: isoprenylcysteine carboxylmethyltransferase family protein, partial [Spirochaetaceae bacterium]|nr:isoprenylcysteine carboxylmethyltransferase family protein [Spirochaetaceae bacterium]MCF7952316.1 isoprenylcysteine carboxylmethyltransferase family protein [Spirochaetaceae bacterium]